MRSSALRVFAIVLIVCVAVQSVAAQSEPEIWRGFAGQIDVGTELDVRLHDGHRFRATLVAVRDDVVMLQPRTRIPVPIQAVRYEEIQLLQRTGKGAGAGKAALIGVASGVATFFVMMAVVLTIASD